MARSSRGDARTQRRSEAERALVQALEQLLSDKPGFVDLNLARLLERAGVSRTSFYKYFDSKVDVLSIWLAETARILGHASVNWSQRAPSRDELRSDLAQFVAVYRSRAPLMAAVYETSAYDVGLREQLADLFDSFAGRLARLISRGQRAGWVNALLDPEEAAAWLVCMAEAGLHQMVEPASDRQVPKLVEAWADTVWFTLFSPAVAR